MNYRLANDSKVSTFIYVADGEEAAGELLFLNRTVGGANRSQLGSS